MPSLRVRRNESAVVGAELLFRTMDVKQSRGDVLMTQLLFDRKQARATVQHVRGEAVAEQVRVDALLNPGSLGCSANNLPEVLRGQRVAVANGDEQLLVRLTAPVFQVFRKSLHASSGHADVPVKLTLGHGHGKQVVSYVHITDAKPAHLPVANTTVGQKFEDRPLSEILGGGNGDGYLSLAQHAHDDLTRLLGPLEVHRVVEERHEPIEHRAVIGDGRKRHVRLSQSGEVCLDFSMGRTHPDHRDGALENADMQRDGRMSQTAPSVAIVGEAVQEFFQFFWGCIRVIGSHVARVLITVILGESRCGALESHSGFAFNSTLKASFPSKFFRLNLRTVPVGTSLPKEECYTYGIIKV